MTLEFQIAEAQPSQWGELFTLQRAAFVDAAMMPGHPTVPALLETYDSFRERHEHSTTLIALEGGRIIGAVSAHLCEPHPEIERLMVAPDYRGQGIAPRLMSAIEYRLATDGHAATRIVVSGIDVDNLPLYERLGFAAIERVVNLQRVDAVVLEKPLHAARF